MLADILPHTIAKPSASADGYLCPMCAAEIHRYRLVPDINGIPRRIDFFGVPCNRCMEDMSRFDDDLK